MKFIPILISLVVFVNCTDYCTIHKDHIGCKNDGKISTKCRSKAKIINLKQNKLKEKIVEIHNTRRNTIALGKLVEFEPALKMATMGWDNELAYLAELNVKTCKFEHDPYRDTTNFIHSGQNIGMWMGAADNIPNIIKSMIDNWFDEYKLASMEIINNFSPGANAVGHFTAMVRDRNTKLGCGMIEISEGAYKTYIMACNYAMTNVVDLPVYVNGKAASGCKTGKNPKFPGLCSIKEKIDPNSLDY